MELTTHHLENMKYLFVIEFCMKIHEFSNIESGKYLGQKGGKIINKGGKTLNKTLTCVKNLKK
jgi:hypothetical protein